MKRDIQCELDPRKCDSVHKPILSKVDKNYFHYGEKSKKVQLMGIINCTPDSFYENSRSLSVEAAIIKGIELAEQGADILDIGGQSSRPGSLSISIEEELERVIPVIKELARSLKIPLSIDTNKPEVAQKALESGACFLNDICGFSDPRMRDLARVNQAKICVMHMLKNPQSMQKDPIYLKGVVQELIDWFEERIDLLLTDGIDPDQIIIDPGIGFGKTVADNIAIIRNIDRFKALGFPVLIGLSRKSFQTKILNKPATELLSTTVALNTISILEGASIIRVHDVIEHRDVIDLLAYFQQ